jgi:drug/metabolite transporter (DMT)-like permease
VAGLVGLAALFRGLAIGTMGVVAPLSSTAVAVPVIVGVATGERPSAAQAAGLAVAFVGMVLAAREPREEGGSGVAAGAGLALVAALGFGCFFLGMDKASDADVPWAILVNRISGVVLLASVFAVLRPRGRPGRADVAPLVAIGALDMTANTLFAIATTKGLVSLVSVVSALYPVTTVVLARVFLGERLAAVQRAGIMVAFAGVGLIAAG